MKYYASVSFGKDSLAMLHLLHEREYPLDEVVFYDTGMEFDAIYRTRDKMIPIIEQWGVKFTQLEPEIPFLEKMLEIPVFERIGGGIHYGYSWCGGTCRWGTSDKLRALKNYTKDGYDYVGIAIDEPYRFNKESRPNRILPLVSMKVSEPEALKYCYKKGFRWLEDDQIPLYEILDRVSCWCCGNKNNRELINIHKFLPHYWEQLVKLQSRNRLPYRSNGQTIFELDTKIKEGLLKYREKKTLHT